MINQFLQVGGVATLKDFYKKFPTEAHFDHYVKMKYGGGIYAYQNGGEPISSDYPSMAAFKAAHDAWEAAQNTPQVDAGDYDYENLSVDENGYPVSVNPNAVVTVKNPVVAATKAKTKLNPYGGVSIVDFLGAQGKATDKGNRKKLAEAMGISGYTGRADENKKLLAMLQASPELLDQYPDSGSAPIPMGGGSGTSSGGRKQVKKVYERSLKPTNLGTPNPFSKFDYRNLGITVNGQEQVPFEDDGSGIPWGAVGAGAFGLGTTAYMLNKINKNTANPRGVFDMGKATGGPKALIGDAAFNLAQRKAAQAANIPRVNQIIADIKLNGRYTANQLRELKNLGVKTDWINNFRASFNAATPAEAAQFLTADLKAANAAKNVSNAAKTAKNAGFWRDVYVAGRNSPMIAKLVKLGLFAATKGKVKPKAYGGETDSLEMLHNHYLQNGGYYQEGGDPGAWHIGGWEVPNWLKTTTQIIDPTGISGWGDAKRSISQAWDDPSFSNILGATFDTLGALPIVGKAGKAAKVAKVAVEGKKVGKIAKAVNKVKKVTAPIVNHSLYPSIKNIDRINPVGNIWTKAVMPRVVGKSPKLEKFLRFTTPINQANRFTTNIATPFVNQALNTADNYFGYDTSDNKVYQDGGSPLYSTQGQTLRDFTNTLAHNPVGWSPAHIMMPPVGFNSDVYAEGGMYDDGRALVNAYSHGGAYGNVHQHGRPQGPNDGTYYQGNYFDDGGSFIPTYGDSAYSLPQYSWGSNYQDGGMPQPEGAPQQPQGQPQGAGIDPQQLMQEVAQMLQQGAQPDQIMQQLVQEGVPQDVAQQIIQQVIQQMQGAQQAPPQQKYGGRYANGGMTKGTEMDVTPEEMEMLKKQGYKFDII